MDDRCDWGNPNQLKQSGCKTGAYIGYFGRELCREHWEMLCLWQDKGKENAAYRKIGLPPRDKKLASVVTETDKTEEQPEPQPQEQAFRKRRR